MSTVLVWTGVLGSLVTVLVLFSQRKRYLPVLMRPSSPLAERLMRRLSTLQRRDLRVPRSLWTRYQFAVAPYRFPAPSIEYSIVCLRANRNVADFCHVALTRGIVDKLRRGEMDGRAVDLVLIQPQFGGSSYSRPIRRLINELNKKGIPTACLLQRDLPKYEYPYGVPPYRNSYLCHEDVYLAIEYLTLLAFKVHTMAAPMKEPLDEETLLHSIDLLPPLAPEEPHPPPTGKTFTVSIHILGYSLGAMRITHTLIDPELQGRLKDIGRRVQQFLAPDYATIKVRLASAAFGYCTLDAMAPTRHPPSLQRSMARFLIEHLQRDEKARSYILHHLSEKTSEPEAVLQRALSSGLLSDLDKHISCTLYGFDDYVDYYRQLLPTGRIHLFDPSIPVLFVATNDDFITGPVVYTEEIGTHPCSLGVVYNRGGHLGTLLSDGGDVTSKIMAEWVVGVRAESMDGEH
ncbi:hypothetical protein GMRT_12536 [Giardia muris]|uniref:Alpha/beta hydrolase family protein n=1 Tax=Giardia muris TaxID=5742 RepID=A0A4Z1SR80_GIAMU|nr:hypothetical protein GMRT_12536 [Giardia muris]|eukprot:TNJ28404.1 hypothetical protein GMRT_12536 [Giardia muris]